MDRRTMDMECQTAQGQIMEALITTLQGMGKGQHITEDMMLSGNIPLIGDGAFIDSHSLVELLLGLEEFIEEQFGANFDWTSDRAMSAKHSPFRTVRTLATFAAEEVGL